MLTGFGTLEQTIFTSRHAPSKDEEGRMPFRRAVRRRTVERMITSRTRERRSQSRSRRLYELVSFGRLSTTCISCSLALLFGSTYAAQPEPRDAEWSNLLQRLDRADRFETSEIVRRLLVNQEDSLAAVRDALHGGPFTTRATAFDIVSATRDGRAVPDLVEIARNDTDDSMRARAVIVLGDIGDSSVASDLRLILTEGNGLFTTSAALRVLGQLGTATDTSLLRKWLADDNELLRVSAASGLARLGSHEGESVLIAGTRSSEALVPQRASEALGFLTSRAARARLEEIMADPNGRWKSHAAIGLTRQRLRSMTDGERVTELARVASGRDLTLAKFAVDELSRMGPPARSALELLSARGDSTGERARILLLAATGSER